MVIRQQRAALGGNRPLHQRASFPLRGTGGGHHRGRNPGHRPSADAEGVAAPFRRGGAERIARPAADISPPGVPVEDEERAGVFRGELIVDGRRFDLVARRPVGGSWAAWVHHMTTDRGESRRGRQAAPVSRDEAAAQAITTTGATPGEALASLAEEIRAALAPPSGEE